MPLPTPTTAAAPTSSTTTSSSSSRWCPTPEQLMILEEMYRTGIRTPNASQIQQITGHLLSYGKIEGKNVFYWFQNHKARDRQRLRRKLSKQLQLGHHHHFCLQQLLNPQPPQQQPQQHQIFNPQNGSINNCFFRYVNGPSPSHSPRSARACCCRNGFLQVGTTRAMSSPRSVVSNKWLLKGTSANDRVETDKMSAMRICGSLDRMLAMDVSPLKTLDLFPTTTTNLREECNLRLSV